MRFANKRDKYHKHEMCCTHNINAGLAADVWFWSIAKIKQRWK